MRRIVSAITIRKISIAYLSVRSVRATRWRAAAIFQQLNLHRSCIIPRFTNSSAAPVSNCHAQNRFMACRFRWAGPKSQWKIFSDFTARWRITASCVRFAANRASQPLPEVGRAYADQAAPVFWKTGTSHGFRDAWSIAVFNHYVLAVLIGNFDGRAN